MDIRDYWRIVRKRWVSIAVCALVGLLLSLGLSLATTKTYSATAESFVAIGGGGADASDGLAFSASTFALQRVKTYVSVAKTPAVLNPVIQDLDLTLSQPELAAMVSASNPPQTLLLNVTVTGTDPEEVAKIANAVAVRYGEQIQRLETPDGAETSPVKVTLIKPAQEPTSPVSPRTKVNLALGLLLGLMLGLGQAILRDLLDTSVKSPDALAEVTGGAALGFIGFDPDATSTPLVALNQQSPRSEAFRSIRTNLQYVDVDNPPQIVSVTSAMPSEGKTTTACNLAITLAQAGKSVCLVEADMRRPKVAQ